MPKARVLKASIFPRIFFVMLGRCKKKKKIENNLRENLSNNTLNENLYGAPYIYMELKF